MFGYSLDPEVIRSQLGIVDGQVERSIGTGGKQDLKHRRRADLVWSRTQQTFWTLGEYGGTKVPQLHD